MRWVIVGCGYTGSHLVRALAARGESVVATRRDEATLDDLLAEISSVTAMSVDVMDPQSLVGLFAAGDIVVLSVPPTSEDSAGERHVVRAAAAAGVRRLVYLSSTGVYPQVAGELVDETVPADPAGSRGQARLLAESAVLNEAADAGLSAVTLRIAGIYGPGRGVHSRLMAGNYRIIGNGDTHVSRIHVFDLVSAVLIAAEAAEVGDGIFNVADDDPETSAIVGDTVASWLGLRSPPRVDESSVPESVRAMLGANRRIDNRRLKSLGWQPQFPSWREGIRAALDLKG